MERQKTGRMVGGVSGGNAGDKAGSNFLTIRGLVGTAVDRAAAASDEVTGHRLTVDGGWLAS
jgi:hypothetical protein